MYTKFNQFPPGSAPGSRGLPCPSQCRTKVPHLHPCATERSKSSSKPWSKTSKCRFVYILYSLGSELKPTLQVGPNSTSRCTLGCINNSSNNRPFTLTMCLRLESGRISISYHASTFQGGNMNPPITMQYHLLPGGGGAHPAAFQPHPNHRAPAPNNVMQVTFLTITETSLV